MRLHAVVLLAALSIGVAGQQTASRGTSQAKQVGPQVVPASLPLGFEPTPVPAGEESSFVAHARGYTVDLTGSEVAVGLAGDQAVRMRLQRDLAGGPIRLAGEDLLPGKTNYYVGPAAQWRVGVPQYRRVRAEGVYPGIGVVFYGNQRQLEYDFQVSAGADPGQIRLAFDPAAQVRVGEDGGLEITLGGSDMTFGRPVAYQVSGSARSTVAARYVVSGTTVGIALGEYDARRELIIDPVLTYATFLGGSGLETGNAVATDSAGNAYLAGQTCSSSGLPNATNAYKGNCDAFVTAVKSDGSAVLYTTYLGGSNGDNGKSIAVDAAGNAVVVGTTNSNDFPTLGAYQTTYIPVGGTSGGNTDAFISRLNPAGQLTYSTYFGDEHDEDGNGVAYDNFGNIVLAGQTGPFRLAPNLYDVYIVKLLAPGFTTLGCTKLYNTNHYPPENLPIDGATGVAISVRNDIFISGSTASGTVAHDALAVIAKFDGTTCGFLFGFLIFPGSSGGDQIGRAVAVDSSGDGIVVGSAGPDAFAAKINPIGSDTVFNKVIAKDSTANAVTVDGNGFIYVAGSTTSSTFPVASATQAVFGGGQDGFLMKMDALGSATIFASYIGGAGSDAGNGIALAGDGSIYVAGSTLSPDLLSVAAPLSARPVPNYGGNQDAFLGKWTGANLPFASVKPLQFSFGDQAVNTSSALQTATLTNLGDAALQITGITTTGQFAETHTCGATLAVGQSCTIKVAFMPSAVGIQSGTVSVVSNAGTQTMALSGNGVLGILQFAPTTLSFGDQPVTTPSVTKTVTLTNAGSQAVTINSIAASGDFTVPSTTCGASLAGGASCTISVGFTPTVLGPRNGALTIGDSAANSPHTVALAGNGVALPDFILTVSPTSNTVTAGGSVAYTVTVTPRGGFAQPVTIGCSNLPANSACSISPATATLDGVNPAIFTVTVSTKARSSANPAPSLASLTFQLSFGMLGLVLVAKRRKRPLGKAGAVCVAFLMVALLVGCNFHHNNGVSAGGTGTPPTTTNGTAAGTYAISVTVSSTGTPSIGHQAVLNLTVN